MPTSAAHANTTSAQRKARRNGQDFLISQGVDPRRLRTVPYGKERPVAVCDNISCWSQNRRAVTVLNGGGAVAYN